MIRNVSFHRKKYQKKLIIRNFIFHRNDINQKKINLLKKTFSLEET